MKLRINIKIKVNLFNLYISFVDIFFYWFIGIYILFILIFCIYDKKYYFNEIKFFVNIFKMIK